MKYSSIYNKVLGLALSVLTIVACSDKWDEHYDIDGGGKVSLWQAISDDAQLSNFARVVEACGYDVTLNSSQVFTVFAPTNDNFTSEEADRLIEEFNSQKGSVKDDDNTVIKEFIRNHISLYNHSVSGASSDSIVMMNGKYLVLSTGDIAGQRILTSNELQRNGVLFKLDGRVNYLPNVFEYLRKDSDLDSVANFLYEYNKYVFDASQSVPGDIVDGQTVYLDSVTVLENELFNYLGRINSEDSTYWMVMPTNDVWTELVEEYEPYFNYDNTVNKRDSLSYTYSRLMAIIGSVFSRTLNPDEQLRDSALSTQYIPYEWRVRYYGFTEPYFLFEKPYEPGGVFYGTENHDCSNGIVMKASEWNFDKKKTFFQKLLAECESNSSLKEIDEDKTRSPLNIVDVEQSNPFYNKISGNSYVEIAPMSSSVNPSATFNITDVLSNIGYDIYVVMAPALAGDTLATATTRLPNKIRFTLNYNDQTGKEKSDVLQSAMETRADVVDTLLVCSDFKFPTCSFDTSSPQVSLKIESRASNSEVNSGKFSRTMRVDCIIFKPHEDN